MSLLLLFGGGSGSSEPEDQPFDIIIAKDGFSSSMLFVPNIVIPDFAVRSDFNLIFESSKDFDVSVAATSSFFFDFNSNIDFIVGADVGSSFFVRFDDESSFFDMDAVSCNNEFYMTFLEGISVSPETITQTQILRYIKGDV